MGAWAVHKQSKSGQHGCIRHMVRMGCMGCKGWMWSMGAWRRMGAWGCMGAWGHELVWLLSFSPLCIRIPKGKGLTAQRHLAAYVGR